MAGRDSQVLDLLQEFDGTSDESLRSWPLREVQDGGAILLTHFCG